MKFVKVKLSDGERIRITLTELNVLDHNYKIIQKDGFLYLPVSKEVADFEIVKIRGQKFKIKKPKTLREALSETLKTAETKALVKSFDLIGDIAITVIPDELESKEKEIANALMSVHPNIRVVTKKLGGMEGEFRVRPLQVIAGENRTETNYHESGCKIKLDVGKVYFSVRLSHERLRIAGLVKPGENVLVMFAGVGPFALVAAKKNPDANFVGVELNQIAEKYFEENISINGLSNCKAIYGDVRKVVPDRFVNWADRVLMPLPKSAEDFLDIAFLAAKNNGVIHLYSFGKEEDAFEEVNNRISEKAKNAGVKFEILNQRVVRPYAPRIIQVCIDLKIVKFTVKK